MREETELLLMSLEDAKKLYDKHVKKLFSNKEITAPILQMVIPEYKDCSLEEIIACMDDISYQKTAVSAIKSMQMKSPRPCGAIAPMDVVSSVRTKVLTYHQT